MDTGKDSRQLAQFPQQNQPNPPLQDSPVCSLPCEQTPWQLTPGLSGTQWSEDLFHSKQPKFHLISTFNSRELTLPPFVEPSQANEPPIPGQSSSSEPHEDVPACEPEPEVAPMQSMEEPFGKSQLFLTLPLTISSLPHSIIIIDDIPVRSPPRVPSPSTPTPVPSTVIPPIAPKNPTASSPHSHDEPRQEFTDLQPTLIIP
ncbi:hypothetical protein O181_115422 [Austropuccinia psidii MF-1]|uniref:Uncharacterized protein n=1 Tax=Austropuccinia psidii MF-1 TaxID=1389203 RepID=A0A9Q3PXD5_9BASI|nr:hypothetical protein [Austropuccinia psidii MF-1]